MGQVIKLDRKNLKRIISEEIGKALGQGSAVGGITPETADRLKRWKINDLVDELKQNRIARTRIKDIVSFFKEYLGDGPYYVIPSHLVKEYGIKVRNVYKKEINPETTEFGYVSMKKNYRPYKSSATYSLSFGSGKIGDGPVFPVVIRENQMDFSDNAYAYFVNGDFLEEYL